MKKPKEGRYNLCSWAIISSGIILEVGVSVIRNHRIEKDIGLENLTAIITIRISKPMAMITNGSNKDSDTVK